MTIEQVMQTLNNRFTSDNSNPVDSTRITANEFQVIQDCIDYLEALEASLEAVGIDSGEVIEHFKNKD